MNTIKKIVSKIKEGFIKKAIYEFSWIYKILLAYRTSILLYTLITLISMGISLSLSLQTKKLVDDLISKTWSGVLLVAVYYIVIGSVNVGLAMLSQRVSAKVNAKIKTELSEKTFSKILHADWETVIELHSGDLMTRMQEDIGTLAESTVGWIPSFISQAFQIIISVGIIVYYDFSMIFIILLVAPIILIGSRIFLGKMYESNKKQREVASSVMSLYKESFQHLQSIKGFGLIDFLL